MVAVEVWHMVLAVGTLEGSCYVRFRPVQDDGVFSVLMCEHDPVAFEVFVVPDPASFPSLLFETLHTSDSYVQVGLLHDIRCSQMRVLPEESSLEDVELFADLSSCIGLGTGEQVAAVISSVGICR